MCTGNDLCITDWHSLDVVVVVAIGVAILFRSYFFICFLSATKLNILHSRALPQQMVTKRVSETEKERERSKNLYVLSKPIEII